MSMTNKQKAEAYHSFAEACVGSVLRCETCGKQIDVRPGKPLNYLFNGWPQCCGHTMRLITSSERTGK